MCCWGRGREGIHGEKPASVLNRICDISSKIRVRGWLRRGILVGLTLSSVSAIVHHYLEWIRRSVAQLR